MMITNPPKNGACVGHPTEWWFPLLGKAGSGKTVEAKRNKKKAIEICETCEVRNECLDYSLHNEPFGIWGGKDEYERDVIRRRRRVPSVRAGMITVPGTGTRRVATNVQPHR